MKILIDSASTAYIKEALRNYEIRGVTTNPAILARDTKHAGKTLRAIKKLLKGKELHVQVVSTTCKEMVKEAKGVVKKLGAKNTYIKIPANKEGLKAIKTLSSNGINTNATAIYGVQQALMSAFCGADVVSPYLGRIDNKGFDGALVIAQMSELFAKSGIKTRILGASFKNLTQVNKAMLAGAHCVTLSPDVMEMVMSDLHVEMDIKDFVRKWKGLHKNARVDEVL